MSRIRLRRAPELRTLAAIVLVGGVAGSPARAGDVAPSAYAASLSMPAFLLEAPWLIHLHPQLTVGLPTHVGATSASSVGSPAAIQAVLRDGDFAFFVLSQSNEQLVTVPITSDLVQIGAAGKLGGVRMGAAFRGGISREDQVNTYSEPGSGPNSRDTEEGHSADRIEGAFGLGLGGERTYLDLVFEATRERFESTVRDSGSQGLYEADIDGRPDVRYGGAIRLGLPGPWESRLQLAGSFRDRTADVTVDHVAPDSLRGTTRRDEYGHLWRAGLTVSRDLRVSSLTFFALYENRDGPTEYERLYASYREYHRKIDADDVQFGVALRREFWWETRLLVGLQSRFLLQKIRTFRLREDDRFDYDSRTTESVSRNFAWGLQRSFENLELTGAMRTDLAAGDLFFSLDAMYRL